MAFDPQNLDPASRAIIDYIDITQNNLQSFALLYQPYAHLVPCQWLELMPFSRPTSHPMYACERNVGHETLVPPQQSPQVNAPAMDSPRAWISTENAMFTPSSLEPATLSLCQIPLPIELGQQLSGLHNSLPRSVSHPELMPTVLASPSGPIYLEPPVVTVAAATPGTEFDASELQLGSHFLPTPRQKWVTNSRSGNFNALAPHAPAMPQVPPSQPELAREVISPPMETACSIYPHGHPPASPLPVVVGDDLGIPLSPSSQGSQALKSPKAECRSGQGYQKKEFPGKGKQSNDNAICQLMHTWRWTPKPKISPEDTQTTRVNRILWPCIEHQTGHHKCNCWKKYVRVASSTSLTRLEFVLEILDIRLFRKKSGVGHPLATRRAESASLEVTSRLAEASTGVYLTQDTRFKRSGFKSFKHLLPIKVVKFTPKEWDKTSRQWYDGIQKRQLEMPHYCITGVADAWKEIRRYIEAALPQYLDYIVQNSSQEVTRVMLRRARAFSKNGQSKMVKAALDILGACRMIEFNWRIVNPDAIGMRPVDDPACPWYGTVPLPPIMDTILDQVIIRYYLEPKAKFVLSELKKTYYMETPHTVSEIILTGFILSTNLQLLLKHSRDNAKRYRASHRYNSLSLAKEYIEGHNILMAYIHILLHGSSGVGQSKRSSQRTGLVVPTRNLRPKDEAVFFANIQRLLSSTERDLYAMRANNMYETDMHWSHDIFVSRWTPHSLDIANADSDRGYSTYLSEDTLYVLQSI